MSGFRFLPKNHRHRPYHDLAYRSESLNSRTPLKPQEKRLVDGDDEPGFFMSRSQEHEMGEVASLPGSDVDEESGMTTKGRHGKHQPDQSGHRIASTKTGEKLSKEAAKLADKLVFKNILINAALIGLWYTFSLSISIVSELPRPYQVY